MKMYHKYLKRSLDIIASVFGLVLTFPLLLVVSIWLLVTNGENPFFLQPRPGRNRKIFNIIKFRTMNNKRDKNGKLLPGMERIHRTGRFLRTTSIDELPQMINVLIGQMSFIGPRPLLKEYLPLYTTEQIRRHNVRPGITGWAQVNGRNTISWTQKFEHDIWYIDHMSLKVDLKITWMTMRKIVTRNGINANGNTTMEPFDIYSRQPKAD